jgi:hypothetical protein
MLVLGEVPWVTWLLAPPGINLAALSLAELGLNKLMAAVVLANTPPNIPLKLLPPADLDELSGLLASTELDPDTGPPSVALVAEKPAIVDSVVVFSVRVDPSSNICVAIIYLFRIFIGLIMYSYYLNKYVDSLLFFCYNCPIRRSKIKHNYLNNKDILKEIHKSKVSYCSYADPKYRDYDMILPVLGKINKKNIMEARRARCERLAKLALEEAVLRGEKRKLDEFEIKLKDVADTDVVFRIMTWDHVPIDDAKTRKARMAALEIDDTEDPLITEYDEEDLTHTKYVKVNFPPFQHWVVNADGEPVMVAKSHWRGDLESGVFSKDHGQMTNKLAHMFMKLCERYATRSNWRGYTYNDEMRSQALLQLAQIGLQFDEAKSANPFAYYTAAITNSFTRVLNIEKRNQNLRDDIMEMNGLTPSYTRQGMSSGGGYGSDSDE